MGGCYSSSEGNSDSDEYGFRQAMEGSGDSNSEEDDSEDSDSEEESDDDDESDEDLMEEDLIDPSDRPRKPTRLLFSFDGEGVAHEVVPKSPRTEPDNTGHGQERSEVKANMSHSTEKEDDGDEDDEDEDDEDDEDEDDEDEEDEDEDGEDEDDEDENDEDEDDEDEDDDDEDEDEEDEGTGEDAKEEGAGGHKEQKGRTPLDQHQFGTVMSPPTKPSSLAKFDADGMRVKPSSATSNNGVKFDLERFIDEGRAETATKNDAERVTVARGIATPSDTETWSPNVPRFVFSSQMEPILGSSIELATATNCKYDTVMGTEGTEVGGTESTTETHDSACEQVSHEPRGKVGSFNLATAQAKPTEQAKVHVHDPAPPQPEAVRLNNVPNVDEGQQCDDRVFNSKSEYSEEEGEDFGRRYSMPRASTDVNSVSHDTDGTPANSTDSKELCDDGNEVAQALHPAIDNSIQNEGKAVETAWVYAVSAGTDNVAEAGEMPTEQGEQRPGLKEPSDKPRDQEEEGQESGDPIEPSEKHGRQDEPEPEQSSSIGGVTESCGTAGGVVTRSAVLTGIYTGMEDANLTTDEVGIPEVVTSHDAKHSLRLTGNHTCPCEDQSVVENEALSLPEGSSSSTISTRRTDGQTIRPGEVDLAHQQRNTETAVKTVSGEFTATNTMADGNRSRTQSDASTVGTLVEHEQEKVQESRTAVNIPEEKRESSVSISMIVTSTSEQLVGSNNMGLGTDGGSCWTSTEGLMPSDIKAKESEGQSGVLPAFADPGNAEEKSLTGAIDGLSISDPRQSGHDGITFTNNINNVDEGGTAVNPNNVGDSCLMSGDMQAKDSEGERGALSAFENPGNTNGKSVTGTIDGLPISPRQRDPDDIEFRNTINSVDKGSTAVEPDTFGNRNLIFGDVKAKESEEQSGELPALADVRNTNGKSLMETIDGLPIFVPRESGHDGIKVRNSTNSVEGSTAVDPGVLADTKVRAERFFVICVYDRSVRSVSSLLESY